MLSKLSVKKPYTVIVGILLVIALGVISFLNMTSDLLPSMDLPYVIVYTVDTGATPEAVETDITRPLEAAFSTLTDIKNVSSTSSENLSLVVLEFSSGADMNTAMIEISSEIDQIKGGWSDSVGTPVIMKLNPDMLPVTVSTVSLDDADLLELSDYVEETLIPKYEAVDGVASVNASGLMTQQVDITIEQSRIDAINSAILREVDAELADVEAELRDAQEQISQGKVTLASAKSAAYGKLNEAQKALDSGSAMMPEAIAGMENQREQLSAQLEGITAARTQLNAVSGMSDAQKAQVMQIGAQLSALESQRDALQAALDSGDTDVSEEEAARQLADAQASRSELINLKTQLESALNDLLALNPETMRTSIAALESSIAENEAQISEIRAKLEAAIQARDAAQRDVTELKLIIAALEPEETEASETAQPTFAPEETDAAETAQSTSSPNESEVPAETAQTIEGTGTPASEESNTPETADAAASETAVAAPETAVAAPETADAAVPETAIAASTESTDTAVPETEENAFVWNFFGSAVAEGESLENLRAQLAAAEEKLNAAQNDVDLYTERHESLRETLTQQNAALESEKESLRQLEAGELAVQAQIAETKAQIAQIDEQIAALDAQIVTLTEAAGTGSGTAAALAQIAALDAQISQIRQSDAYQAYLLLSDEAALQAQIAQLDAAETQIRDGISSIDSMLDKLNRGIIPGGMIEGMDEDTAIADARGLLSSARSQMRSAFSSAGSQLAEAEEEIAKALREFEDKRDEALENAGIDSIVTVQLISQILGAQNFDMPAGYVSDAEGRYLVSVGTKFKSLNELKQVKLFSLGLDSVDDVRLLDVAKVEISDNSAELFTLVNGENGIMLSFEKQSTASTAEVAKAITAKSESLMAENEKLHVMEMFNQGDYISLIVNSVLENIEYGGVLAILVLLLFLMDWRPTLIVALSIPASVVVAFVCMYFTGITLNVMSLSGLALGVGMLVDNSIVAIENIYRLRDEEHLPILTACIRGVNQVSGALIASTLTTICVFLPVVFVTGMARDLFSDMGLTIAFSLIASLVVAMTVVPSFSATLFKHSKPKRHRIFDAFQRGYTAVLRGALRVKWLVILLALALLGWSVWQVKEMGISFMPTVNSTQMSASLSFDDSDRTEDEKQEIALNIMNEMMAVEGVSDVSLTGSGSLSMMSSMGGAGDEYSYYMLVEEGLRKNHDIADEIRAQAAEFCGEDAVLSIQESTMDLSAFAGRGISVDIYGSEIEDLRAAARQIAAVCAQIEGAENVDDGSDEAAPKLIVTVDKELANDNSLTVAQVYQYIAQRLYGAVELTEARLDGRDFTLYVNADENMDLEPADIANMEIEVKGTDNTKYVRIGDIAAIEDGETLSGIRRENQKRTVSVSFTIADGFAANHVSDALEEKLSEIQLPDGCSWSISGQNEQVMSYMKDLVTMLAIAILFIFLIMVAQFQSFKSPIIVMFTIPLAFTGGLLALILTGQDISIIAMVGFLVLSGVVVNNGIVFIDSINQMRIGGMKKRDAIVETGRIRLRPILMTALTTILGMSTMALGKGMGSEMMQPMAIVTIGGLTYATLMTLFVVPALYDILNGERMKAREIEMMKEAAGMKREGFDDDLPAVPVTAAEAASPAPVVPVEPEPHIPDPIPAPESTGSEKTEPEVEEALTQDEIEALKRKIWEAERRLYDRKKS